MRRFFGRRPKAATTGSAAQQSQSERPPVAASSSTKTFPSGIKPLCCPAGAIVDIVFVHGLTGDREKTWTASDASEPWPKALLPSELPAARVLTFGYDAYVTDWRGIVSQNRIANHAWDLLTSLASYREKDDTALFTSRQRTEPHLHNVLRLTRGIAFLGTPHHGSGLARWAELLSRSIGIIKQTNTQIVEVLKRDSEVLARIQDGFHTMVLARGREGQSIEISCFFEQLPLPGIGQVVPQDSAILPGYIPIGIRGNHMDMTKFASADDPGFQAVCGELRRWVKQLGRAAPLDGNLLPPGSGSASQDGELGPAESDRRDGPQSDATMFLVPYTCNPDFVGRSDILEKLKDQLGLMQRQSKWHLRAALYGLGGIGKTQIALAYVYWLREEFPDLSVFWVDASNTERFHQSYASIAQECHVPGHDDPKADVVPLLKRWLASRDRGRWLMVLDNADDTQLASGPGGLGQHIPECAHGSVLVTTRNKEVGSRLTRGGRPIEVEKMDDSESNELLEKKLEQDRIDPSDLSTLSSRLEHLPLALVQAAAFMQEKSVPISRYLELLDNSDQDPVDLLSEEFETDGRDSGTPRAVAETWILSFEQIKRQNAFAAELLSLMSLFDRQAIPLEFLFCYSEQQGQEQRGEIALTKALGLLKAFSFVTENQGYGFDMHRLVQLVTQKWLARKGTIRQFAEHALLVVSQAYPYGSYENRAICNAFLPHVYAVLRLESTGSKDERLARASILHCAAGFFAYQGQWNDAEKFQLQARGLRREVLGEEHPSTLASMADLASTYWKQGRWKEAESLQVQVMEARKRVLGEEHPYTLTSMNNLASTYRKQCRWNEAESLGTQVTETSLRVLGEEHPSTLTSMADLASTYWNQGRRNEAEALEAQVMETRKKVLGEEHPDTLSSMASLALTYWNQGRWKEAALLGVQVMETRKRVLGEEHSLTLTSMADLALTYWKQGRWKEAESLQVQVMKR
ncbi:TPR-like protein [Parathielavia appendiculata]|uniref:TPR-like protein n=1 Tax=Parathielavia appendiculata TaxID=2587402 RepID=A0AAN6YZI7_9PEZI|nr:TPR-like protein [Parathielavia appendiculata]